MSVEKDQLSVEGALALVSEMAANHLVELKNSGQALPDQAHHAIGLVAELIERQRALGRDVYTVIYERSKTLGSWEFFVCWALSVEDAEMQCGDEVPGASILWVNQGLSRKQL